MIVSFVLLGSSDHWNVSTPLMGHCAFCRGLHVFVSVREPSAVKTIREPWMTTVPRQSHEFVSMQGRALLSGGLVCWTA
jgi:hypothetical protein